MRAMLIFSLLTLPQIAACSTLRVVPVEIPRSAHLTAHCASVPALSDAEMQALLRDHPDAAERERVFWSPRALDLRQAELCERARADALNATIDANNAEARRAR